MAKVYDSEKNNGAAERQAEDRSFRPAEDVTAITSEKLSARYFIPLLVAIIIFSAIFFITSRFSGNSGRDYKAGDAPVRPGTEQSINSGVSGSAVGR